MKGKLIGLVLLFFLGIGSSLLVRHQMPSSENKLAPIEHEEIIAPAVVDSLNDIIRIPVLQGGVVSKIHVNVGQKVKKGDALISLDDAVARYHVRVNKIGLRQAKTNLMIQENALKRASAQLKRLQSLDKRAYSQLELEDKTHEVRLAKIKLDQAQYKLDIKKAQFKNAKAVLNQFTVVAPKDGIVLQVNAHVDEYVGGTHQIIFLGDAKKILVRVSVDERDIKNLSSNTLAYITQNENDDLKIPLTFIQSERYIISHERLNSRVLESLYFFNRDDYPGTMAGQQFDAHIVLK